MHIAQNKIELHESLVFNINFPFKLVLYLSLYSIIDLLQYIIHTQPLIITIWKT